MGTVFRLLVVCATVGGVSHKAGIFPCRLAQSRLQRSGSHLPWIRPDVAVHSDPITRLMGTLIVFSAGLEKQEALIDSCS